MQIVTEFIKVKDKKKGTHFMCAFFLVKTSYFSSKENISRNRIYNMIYKNRKGRLK